MDNANICADALALLKDLSQETVSESGAWCMFERFRAAHPRTNSELVTTRAATAENIDYDLLIEEDGGTIAVSWRPNNGIPWTVRYAEHHTAGKVLSVGDVSLEIQDVLLLFKLIGGDHSNLRDRLLRYALIRHAIKQSPPLVSDIELQAAADRFRRNRGLLSADAAQTWLKEVGLTPQGMQKYLRQIVQTGKLKKRVTRDRLESFFGERASEFDLLQLLTVEAPTRDSATALATEGGKHGLLTATQTFIKEHQRDADALTGRLLTHRVFELSTSFQMASRGTIVGPALVGNTYHVSEVLQRKPATFDGETQALVEERLFDEWLDEQHRHVDIQWHLRI